MQTSIEFRDDGGTPAWRARQAALRPRYRGVIARLEEVPAIRLAIWAVFLGGILPWVIIFGGLMLVGLWDFVTR